jgi:MFS family permease
MFATNTALLNHGYEGRDRSVAFGIWGAINGAAAAVAPVLGGLLIAAAGWRTIFLVNLPIAIVAAIMTQRTLAESHGHTSPIDWAGAASFTVSAAALTWHRRLRLGVRQPRHRPRDRKRRPAPGPGGLRQRPKRHLPAGGLAAVACGLLAMALIPPERAPAPAAPAAAAPGSPGMSEAAPTVRS